MRFHEGKGATSKPICLWSRTDSSLAGYCDLGDKLGHSVPNPPARTWILLYGKHKAAVQSSEAPSTTPAAEDVTGAAGVSAGS